MRASTPDAEPSSLELPGPAASGTVLEQIVRAWPEPALVASRDGRIAAWNEAARDLLGSVLAEAGTTLGALVGAEDARALLESAGPLPSERILGEDRAGQPVLRARAASLGA